jgi:hypothetical protein
MQKKRPAQFFVIVAVCAASIAGAQGADLESAQARIQSEAATDLAANAIRRVDLERQWTERSRKCISSFASNICLARLERDRQQAEREMASIDSAARAKLRESRARERIQGELTRRAALEQRDTERAARIAQAGTGRLALRNQAAQESDRQHRDASNRRDYQAKLERHEQAARERARVAASRQMRTAAGGTVPEATQTQ